MQLDCICAAVGTPPCAVYKSVYSIDMKLRDLERELAKRGWTLAREGGRHAIWGRDGRTIAVPRHKEINEHTARQILKDAE